MQQLDQGRRVRCDGCGHVGNRVFVQGENGDWRDVLGGALGVRPEDCVCTYCDSADFTMLPALRGSYAMQWELLDEYQQTCRLDMVLRRAGDFIYVTERDAYRAADADQASPDYCPAAAVEARRRILDRRTEYVRDIPSDYDFLDVPRVEYTGPDRFVEVAGERVDLNDVPDAFKEGED